MKDDRHRPPADRRLITDPIPPAWKGETVVCVASGPSLTVAQVNTVRQAWCMGDCRVIAVNRAYEMAPFADALYASDLKFWLTYISAIKHTNIDLLFSTTLSAAEKYGLWYTPGPSEKHNALGVSLDPSYIHWGKHSGFQALNLAAHLVGLSGRIILLGYDCQFINGKRHFHEDHKDMVNAESVNDWAVRYNDIPKQIEETDLTIVNATADSAILAFEKNTIGAAIYESRDI